MSLPCPGCGSEGKHHGEGCSYEGAEDAAKRSLDQAKELVKDPEAYELWLKESMAAHLVRLDIEARKGDVKAAQAFRIGALEVLEVLDAEAEGRETGRSAAGSRASGGSRGGAAARAIANAVGKPPEALAGSEGHGRQPSGDDEGRAGPDEPDQAVSD